MLYYDWSKGDACSIYCENHRQTAMYTVVVVFMDTSCWVIVQAT